MGIAEDAVVLPDDGAVIPASTLSAIIESDAYPESTGFTRTIEYVDFEMHGKPFTQVVMTLRPETPRLHDGKEILLIAGEGGSDNGNGFLATYEGKEGIGPWIAKRGITFVAVPRLGRWNFFAPDQSGSWADIPLGERMPVFDRGQPSYWSPADYTSHASQGQASPTGSDTYRLPKTGTALYDHMLAATADALVDGYRRGVAHALGALGRPRDDVLLLYWGFSTGGPFLWPVARFIAPDGMLGWGTSSTGIAYFHCRTRAGRYDWPYENSVLRVRERGRPDFRFYTEHIDDDLRELWWQKALGAPRFKSIEDTAMFYNVAALSEHAGRLWHSDFLPETDRDQGFAAFVRKTIDPCFPAEELRSVAVWEMNGTLDQVIQPEKVDAARGVMEPYCRRYRVARLEGFHHDILYDTITTVGRIWLKVIGQGYFD